MVAGSAVQKYGPDLEQHQQLLMAAADILIEIYMAESAILRTEKLAKKASGAFPIVKKKHSFFIKINKKPHHTWRGSFKLN